MMPERAAPQMEFQHAEAAPLGGADADAEASEDGAAQADRAQAGAGAQPGAAPFVRPGRKVGRNEPCPCGSGKKYKQCHGRLR